MSFSQTPFCLAERSMPNQRTLFAWSSCLASLSVSMPPSPVVMCLIAWKEKMLYSEIAPTGRPLYVAPSAPLERAPERVPAILEHRVFPLRGDGGKFVHVAGRPAVMDADDGFGPL